MRSLKLLKTLLLSLPLFLLVSNAWALTDFEIEVRDSGGDYTSLSLAESAIDNNLIGAKVLSHSGITGTIADGASVTGATSGATGTVVTVTSTQILIYGITGTFQNSEQIYETEDTNYVTSTSAPDDERIVITVYNDQTGVTFDGGTYQNKNDGQLNLVRVQGDITNWDGTESGAVTINAGGQWGISLRDRGVNFHYFWIKGTDDSTFGSSWETTHSNLICDGCGFGSGFDSSTPKFFTLVNCVSLNSPGNGFSGYISTSNVVSHSEYNCVAINAGQEGFSEEYGQAGYAYNSVSFGSTDDDFNSGYDGDYNACSDTSCSIFTNNVQELTMADELVDGANGDVHLKSTSNLIDEGNDYSSTTGIDYDIDNVTRSGTWDIGADEYVATAGGATNTIIRGAIIRGAIVH